MRKQTRPTDAANFEVATIQDGHWVDVVYRRRGAAILTRLLPAERPAVETYIATAEAVMAGGATNPRDSLTATAGGSGGLTADGRQAGYVDQVTFLRRMEAAVASDPIQLRAKPLVEFAPLDLWRRVCLGDISMKTYLIGRKGLTLSEKLMKTLKGEFLASCDRVADAIARQDHLSADILS